MERGFLSSGRRGVKEKKGVNGADQSIFGNISDGYNVVTLGNGADQLPQPDQNVHDACNASTTYQSSQLCRSTATFSASEDTKGPSEVMEGVDEPILESVPTMKVSTLKSFASLVTNEAITRLTGSKMRILLLLFLMWKMMERFFTRNKHTNHDGFQYPPPSHGTSVGSKFLVKPKKPIWQVISKNNSASSSGTKKNCEVSRQVMSLTNPFDALNTIEEGDELGSNGGHQTQGKPLKPSKLTLPSSSNVVSKKVKDLVNEDNDSEVKEIAFVVSLINMACYSYDRLGLKESCKGTSYLPKNVYVPAIIAFGDSLMDPGNNNFLNTFTKANFPPYGKDFLGGKATGRFTNGKIIGDYLGGTGLDPLTSTLASVIPLSFQVEMFEQYIQKIKKKVGEEDTMNIIHNSVYFISASSNDFLTNYFVFPFRRLQYDVPAYSNFLVKRAVKFIKEIHKLGARRIVVFSASPIGCIPIERTLNGGPKRKCVDEYNKAAKYFNIKLKQQLQVLARSLPESRIAYSDFYNPLTNIIENPRLYGLEVTDKGCCGTGQVEMSFSCNSLSKICHNDSKFFFWDSLHPTEKGCEIFTDLIIPDLVKTKGNILGMEIVKDQSGNTLRVSQSSRKLVLTLLEGHSILLLEGSLSGECDVKRMISGHVYMRLEATKKHTGFVDYDYAMGRSITGYGFIIQGCAGSWKAYVQHMKALSITEAAYMTLTEAAKEAIWLTGTRNRVRIQAKDSSRYCCRCLVKGYSWFEVPA
nr:GDSL esterase/lipase At5g42170-like [Tanacetum cinerariifolium]